MSGGLITHPLDIPTPQKGPSTRETHPTKGPGTRDTPHPELTHACENITFLQLRLHADLRISDGETPYSVEQDGGNAIWWVFEGGAVHLPAAVQVVPDQPPVSVLLAARDHSGVT